MLGADTRGQAIQIGAVVLFSFVVLTFSLYQASVVPDNNAEVEFNHNDEVQQDLTQLRASVLTAAATGNGYPVPVDLGPRYPPRVIAVNPGPPSGTLTTVAYGSGQLTVANVRATDAEAADYWSGSVSYPTGGVEYRPNYNVYAEAPTTAYENSVLYNVFDSPAASGPATVDGDTVRLSSDQTLVDGKRVNLVALVGERRDSTTETVSVDPTATTVPSRTVTVQGDGGPLTVRLPTNLNEAAWRSLLADEYVANGGYVEAGTVGVSSGVVSFDLRETEGGTPVTYQLRVPAVGVGSSLPSGTAPAPAYTTAASPTTVTATPGETVRLTAGVANQYNGPESDVPVEASAGGTTVDSAVTGADGEAVVTYTAPSSPGSYTVTVEADFDGDGTFGEDSTETVTFTVDVAAGAAGGGDGTPPGASGVSATPDPLTQGDALDLAATFDDIGQGGSDIISASWSDARSGDSGSLSAVDGEFDQPREAVETTVPGSTTSGWATGDHDITITGTDANGNAVPRTVTVTVQSTAGGPSLITAVEPNPRALPDSDGEFVRLEIPSGVDTTGWTLREQDDATPITRNLDGEVYLVRDEAAFESQWPVDPAKVFQYDSEIVLDNAGQTVELVDDGGTVVDRFSYGDGDGGSFADGSRFSLSGEGQVAYRTQSGGSFTDTDGASDWAQDAECDFFGGGGGCGGGSPPSVTSITVEDAPIDYADAANQETVTVRFDEPMDTSVEPTVTLSGVTASDTSGDMWVDDTTFREAVDIAQNSEDVTATVEVRDAQDVDGDTMSPNPETATFVVDTQRPGDVQAIATPIEVSASNDDSLRVDVTNPGTVYGDEQIRLTFERPDGNEVTVTEPLAGGAGDTTSLTVDVSGLADGTTGFTVSAVAVDDVGNTGATKTVTDVEKDTVAPSVETFDVTRTGADEFTVTVEATDATTGVADLGLTIDGPGSATRIDTNSNANGDTYTYEWTYRVGQPGEYTATLDSIVDGVGNDGASGESDSATVSAAAGVTYNGDGSIYNGQDSAVQFSVSNRNADTVIIERVMVTTTDSRAEELKETDGGTGPGAREIFVSASDNGYYEAGDTGNRRYSLGTTVSLSNTASISGGTDATFTLDSFYDGGSGSSGSYLSQRGETVTVVVEFSDGSTKEIDVAVPN